MPFKDRIIAVNAYRKNHLEGKAANSNKHNSCIFQLLQATCIKTTFTRKCGEAAFIAPQCEMISTEWMCQIIQLVLKRNPAVKKGCKFYSLNIEILFKKDADNEPLFKKDADN